MDHQILCGKKAKLTRNKLENIDGELEAVHHIYIVQHAVHYNQFYLNPLQDDLAKSIPPHK
jgi:hypothetical protein